MYPFMRNVYYWHNNQPRTVVRKGKSVTVGGGPSVLGAVMRDGSVILVDLQDPDWHAKASDIPTADIVGQVTQGQDGRWYGEYRNPHNAMRAVGHDRDPKGFGNAENAAKHVVEARDKEIAEDLAILADPVQHLERELASHDWYCHMSDAPGVYGAGAAHMRRIMDIIKDVPAEKVREIWAKHAPHAFACPV